MTWFVYKKKRNVKVVRFYVNWDTCAKHKCKYNGRLPLFTAAAKDFNLSHDGLGHILKGNGAAIEDVDPVTGVEAFMLSASGSNSKLEAVYTLLVDHPAAIMPYV